MQITGRLKYIGATQEVSASFKKRDMTQGEQQKKLAEIFVLTSSLIDRLDNLS